MKKFESLVKRFVAEEAGLETVEYAVIAALITAVGIAAITGLGNAVAAKFTALTALIGP